MIRGTYDIIPHHPGAKVIISKIDWVEAGLCVGDIGLIDAFCVSPLDTVDSLFFNNLRIVSINGEYDHIFEIIGEL